MKGKERLYNKLIKSSIPERVVENHTGRAYFDEWLDLLACRYYFHANLNRKRYDDCLMELSREFFRTSRVLVDNLEKRLAFIQKMVDNKTKASDLRKRYPWYDWTLKS